jgi:hypothetical protein
MSANKKIVLLTTICLAAVIAVGLWRYHVAGKSRSAHAVIVRDRSDSVLGGCDCTAALITRAFSDPRTGAGSTVTITTTGDEASAGEPRLLASVEIPRNRQALEGRESAGQQRQKLIEDIKAKCEKIPQTKVSPILIAIKRAVEHLRGLGCSPDSGCVVYVQTDLEETGDPQVKVALNHQRQPHQTLPTPVNNDGISVVLSGIAETVGVSKASKGKSKALTRTRDTGRAGRIESVWRSLFTSPDRVTFEPYCANR